MKRLILFAATAIMMAACTIEKDVTVDSAKQQIAFTPINYALTRAEQFTGTTFPAGNPMYVSAIYQGEDGKYSEYFKNVKFQHPTTPSHLTATDEDDNTVNVWTSGWYYPLSGTMQFMAFSTTNSTVAESTTATTWNITANETTGTFGNITIDFASSPLTGREDFMFSNIKSGVECGKGTKAQTLTFNHGLSWIDFYFAAENADVAKRIKIKSISVNNAAVSGKATITPNSTASSIVWVPATPNATNNVSNTAGDLAITTVGTDSDFTKNYSAHFGNGILVTPDQKMASFTIEYELKYGPDLNNDAQKKTLKYTHNMNPTNSEDLKYKAGMKYTYYIKIGLNEIQLAAKVNPYDTTDYTGADLEF